MTCLQTPTTQFVEVGENGIFVTPEVNFSLGCTMVGDLPRQEAVRFFEGAASTRNTSMKMELSLSAECIEPGNTKNRVSSIPPNAPLLILYVKMEDVVPESASGRGVERSSAGRNAYDQWQIALPSLCMVYDAPF